MGRQEEGEGYVWVCRKKKKNMYGYVGRRIGMGLQEEEENVWVCKKKKKKDLWVCRKKKKDMFEYVGRRRICVGMQVEKEEYV